MDTCFRLELSCHVLFFQSDYFHLMLLYTLFVCVLIRIYKNFFPYLFNSK
jgi:hypothetical protein